MSRFPAPPEAMEEHSAIIGKTGAGKTYTAKGFAEDLLAEGARFCVIDPTGVWWGLKSSGDGESEGFPVVVFGGDHGDVPLDEHDAEKVAEIVATTATPCVLDVSAFPSRAALNRFMTEFAEHVFRLNREALHLFVDEADAFMPQRPGPDEMMMLGRWDTIARRGRSRGFRLTLITQRPAVLNKNALSQVGTLIALKLTSPQDRKAIGDWIEGNADKAEGKALLATLPSLNRGEGWVWSPGHDVLERVQFSTISTWDSSRTPGKGEIHREAKALARADISAILSKMNTPHAQKVGEVRSMPDADALKAAREAGRREGAGEALAASADELARLTKDLRAIYSAAGDNARAAVDYASRLRTTIAQRHPAAVAGLDEPALWLMDHRQAGGPLLSVGNAFDDLQTDFMRTMLEGAAGRFTLHEVDSYMGEKPGTRVEEPQDLGPTIHEGPLGPSAAHGFSPAATRMALALAERYPASITRKQWGTLARVAERGGTFAVALKALREAGFYTEATQRATASDACRAFAVEYYGDAPRHGWESEFAMWRSFMPSTAQKLLDALRDLGGVAAREDLAKVANLAAGGGAFSTAMKVLRENELLTSTRQGGVITEVSSVAKREAQRLRIIR